MLLKENQLSLNLWVRYAFFAILAHVSLPLFLGYAVTISPFEAFALFTGAYFSNRRIIALGLILLPIGVSDLFINYIYLGRWMLLYPGFYWQYASFLLIALVGTSLKNRITVLSIGASSLLSAILFFIISNFGVWTNGLLYPLTQNGLILCYEAAIPFFKYSLLGNGLYGLLLFGSMEGIRFLSTKQETIGSRH